MHPEYRIYGLKRVNVGDREGVWSIVRIDCDQPNDLVSVRDIHDAAMGFIDCEQYEVVLIGVPGDMGSLRRCTMYARMPLTAIHDGPWDMETNDAIRSIVRTDYARARNAKQQETT